MVKKAQQIVLKETIHHNYLPVFGNNNFLKAACALLLGDIIVENKWKEGTVIMYIFCILLSHNYILTGYSMIIWTEVKI